ncbi:DUF4118 domain-containing protein [Streptomyces sp. NPDC014735]|uniref:sensor histidine kinase n=1 Tax=unclassified Streptomyces TaxID=2593676 RepID=UPI0036F79F90
MRGGLHLYLGTAPGVGKTCALLAEGRRLAALGNDVVVGLAEAHDRQDTAAGLDDLEVIPRKSVAHRGARFGEMDVQAILVRHPQTVLVDELAHANAPGSRHDKRWQDVEELLDAGVDVVSALNVQHLQSLSDQVEELTGVPVHETVPDAVADAADRVDLDPESLRRRLTRIYPPGTAEWALAGFFRPGNIAVLRELADQWIREHAHDHAVGRGTATVRRGSRIVAALTGEVEGERVLHRAAQLAAGTGAELVGVHVRNPSGLKEPDPPWLNGQRRLLAELGGRYAQVAGEDVAGTILDFTRAKHASQLVLGASRRSHGYQMLYGSVIDRVVRAAGPVEVHVIPPHRPPKHPLTARLPRLARPVRRSRVPLPVRRTAIGWTLSVLAPPAVTALLLPARGSLGLAGALLCTLLTVVLAALVGGLGPAALATVTGFLAADFLYTRPYYSLRVDRPIDLVGLFVFAVVGVTVGLLVDSLARRALQQTRAQAEAESLARLVADVLAAGTTTPADLVDTLRRTFDLEGVVLLRQTDGGWEAEAAAGTSPPATPEDAPFSVALAGGRNLALAGSRLSAEDARLLRAFTGQLRIGQGTRQLERIGGDDQEGRHEHGRDGEAAPPTEL